jgi:hypothetical protein
MSAAANGWLWLRQRALLVPLAREAHVRIARALLPSLPGGLGKRRSCGAALHCFKKSGRNTNTEELRQLSCLSRHAQRGNSAMYFRKIVERASS